MEESNCVWTLGIKGLPPLRKVGTATHMLHPQPQLVVLCSTPHEITYLLSLSNLFQNIGKMFCWLHLDAALHRKNSKSSSTSPPSCSLPQMAACMSSLCSFLIASKTNQHTKHPSDSPLLPSLSPKHTRIFSPYHPPGQQKFKSSPGEMPPWEISCRSHSQVLLFTAQHCQYPSLLCSLVLCRP